ncbi:MAG: hypothetical protein PWQ17_1279 [Anaerophaga sp.]|nr:hypothetical protein [Anaerophaga sp.]MDN5291869.1 hypothetical protein [Anaerophaga sp.]
MYDYLFYNIYRFWEKAPSRWWSEWKSVLTICFFIVQIILSIYSLIMYRIKANLLPDHQIWSIVGGVVIFGANYYYFLYKDKWKDKISRFKYLNKTTDRVGILLTIFILLFIAIGSIYSVYLLSTVDWHNID